MAEEAIILWSGCITWLWSNQISVCPFVKTTIREQNKANWLAQSNLPRKAEWMWMKLFPSSILSYCKRLSHITNHISCSPLHFSLYIFSVIALSFIYISVWEKITVLGHRLCKVLTNYLLEPALCFGISPTQLVAKNKAKCKRKTGLQ